MLTTLVPPTSGSARVNGFDVVREADSVRRSIGVIPQAMTSDLDLTAEENMGIFAKLYGIRAARAAAGDPGASAGGGPGAVGGQTGENVLRRHEAPAGNRPRPGA